MKSFTFKAKDQNGNLIKGEVEAVDPEAAARLVRKRGLIVISIDSKSTFANPFSQFNNRITSADVAAFTRQMATMVDSGLPLTEALSIAKQGAKPQSQRVLSEILSQIEQGSSLYTCMSKYPNVFSKPYIALIKAGETSGILDVVLNRLADDLEKQEEFRAKVKGALVYPIIIVSGMMIVALVMMVFVIPRLTSLYSQLNAELPLSTKILMSASSSLTTLWPLYLFLIIVAFYGFKVYKATPAGAKQIDEIILKLPIIGNLQRLIILTDLTRMLGLMVGSGVSILEALSITSEAMSNTVISQALVDISKSVEKGFPLAYSFSRHPEAFPFILSKMITVGEETGKIDEVLAKISHIFETESEQQIKALTVALEPTILVILGLGVAFLVLSIIMPIYNLTTKL